MGDVPRKRIWVQNVAVSADVLEIRVNEAKARGLSAEQDATANGVGELIRKARLAAFRQDPIPGRFFNWVRGTLVEAAYRNLHAARAEIIGVYDDAELMAEIPSSVARLQETINRDDPRRISPEQLSAMPMPHMRARLRQLIQDGYDALDQEHARLRNFRNIVLLLAASVILLVSGTIVLAAFHPTDIPLCYNAPLKTSVNGPVQDATSAKLKNCPSGSNVEVPRGGDAPIAALVGLLGGSLAAAVSIRNLRGTSTAYDVPVALAFLKVPLGAFTAILGLVAIRGGFVPGLTALDSQEQILAYALLLGYGQQAFTRLLDKKAQSLLDQLPAKDVKTAPSSPPTAPPPGSPTDGRGGGDIAAPLPDERLGDLDYLDNPEGDNEGQIQDPAAATPIVDVADQSTSNQTTTDPQTTDVTADVDDVLPNAPEEDHT